MENLQFICTAIGPDGLFRIDNTGRGADLSPEFRLQNLSADAAALAVILEDVSHPLFHCFTHWVIWNIPAGHIIPGSLPAGKFIAETGGAMQGRAYGYFRYAGPKPPRGKCHRYRFTVYALDSTLSVPFPQTKRCFLRSASGHILQMGSIEGVFK